TEPGGSVMREQTLSPVPTLGSLYAQALSRTARLAMTRPAGDGRLPQVAYTAELRADAAGLSAYQTLLGEAGTDELPAGYVHVLAFPLAMALMVRPDFPLPVLGLVHVENRVVQRRAVRLEDALTVRAGAGPRRPHRRVPQVDLVRGLG